mmetsp:Transcript_23215/g.46612  ORF Transcript_23215/g.46612 Transcript_23215/m.46612 type:complete len:621 (+) Transcript_23215:138-2000(+)
MGNQQLGFKAPRRVPDEMQIALLEDLQRRAMTSVCDPQHEPIVTVLLKRFWAAVQGEKKKYVPKGKEWQGMGFQGEDPLTDFRAGGLLALENIVFLVEKYTDIAKTMIEKREMKMSEDGTFMQNYPWSAAGVNVTHMVMGLFGLSSQAKSAKAENLATKNKRFWELVLYFNEVYCVAFKLMDNTYTDMKATYLSFNKVLEASREELNGLLKHTGVQEIFKTEQQPLISFLQERRKSVSMASINVADEHRSRSVSPEREAASEKGEGGRPSERMIKNLLSIHKSIMQGKKLLAHNSTLASSMTALNAKNTKIESKAVSSSLVIKTSKSADIGDAGSSYANAHVPSNKRQGPRFSAKALKMAGIDAQELVAHLNVQQEQANARSTRPLTPQPGPYLTASHPKSTPAPASTPNAAAANEANKSEDKDNGTDGGAKAGGAGAGPEEELEPGPGGLPCRLARAIFDFEAQDTGDLSLKEGDTVIITYSDESGWWEGEGKKGEGRFPSNYVEEFKSCWFEALAEYKASTDTELSLKENDIVQLTEVDPSGWWKGIKHGTTATGWFPAAYVEPCQNLPKDADSVLNKHGLDHSPTRAPDGEDGGKDDTRDPRRVRGETLAEFGNLDD